MGCLGAPTQLRRGAGGPCTHKRLGSPTPPVHGETEAGPEALGWGHQEQALGAAGSGGASLPPPDTAPGCWAANFTVSTTNFAVSATKFSSLATKFPALAARSSVIAPRGTRSCAPGRRGKERNRQRLVRGRRKA